MRNLLLKSMMAFALSLAFMACENDDDNKSNNNENINIETLKAFDKLYPEATNINWRTVGNFEVANFMMVTRADAGQNIDAWFTDATLQREDIEFETLLELPQVIQDAFAATKYSDTKSWEVDDIEFKSKSADKMANVYVIEVENKLDDKLEYDIIFGVNGEFLLARLDTDQDTDQDDMPITVPQEIVDYVKIEFPNAQFIDAEIEDNGYEVEFITDTTKDSFAMEMSFNKSYKPTEIEITVIDYTKLSLPYFVDFGIAAKITEEAPNFDPATDKMEVEITGTNIRTEIEVELEIDGNEIEFDYTTDPIL